MMKMTKKYRDNLEIPVKLILIPIIISIIGIKIMMMIVTTTKIYMTVILMVILRMIIKIKKKKHFRNII